MFPTRTGKRESIFQSGNFAKTGKIRKNCTDRLEKNTGNVWKICQPVIVKTLQIWSHTLIKKKKKGTLKSTGNCEKHWKICQSEKWEL